MKKFYSFLMLTVLALVGFTASAAKTVIVNVSGGTPADVVLRSGDATGEVLSFTENNQAVSFDGSALYITTASDDYILDTVTFDGSNGYQTWGSVNDGVCTLKVEDMKEGDTYVYLTLVQPTVYYFQVPDPSLITLEDAWSHTAYTLHEGLNEFKVSPNSSFDLYVKDPEAYKLTEVYLENRPDVKFDVKKFSSCYLGSYNIKSGDIIAYTVVPASEFEAPSFFLTVDEPSKVSVSLDYVPIQDLQANTEAEIELSGDYGTLTISPVSYTETIFKVTVNDKVVNPSYSSYYSLTVYPEDVVVVTYAFPDIDFTFKAICTPEENADCLSATVNGEPYTFGEEVSAKAGSPIAITFDRDGCNVETIIVNGTPLDYPKNPYNFNLAENTVVEYVVERFPEVEAYVNVTDPAGVTVSLGYSNVLSLEPGMNKIVYKDNGYGQSLNITPKGGYNVTKITSEVNGVVTEHEVQPYGIAIYLEPQMVITIDVTALEKNTKAVVYANFDKSNPDFYSFTFQSSYDKENFDFVKGYNEIEFNDAQSKFVVTAMMEDFSTAPLWVYVNGEEVSDNWGAWSFTLENNSVLKIFLGDEPETYVAEFEVAEGVEIDVVTNLVEDVYNLRAGVEDKEGTLIQIFNAAREGIEVVVEKDGEEPAVVVADEKGVFNVTLDADMTIKVSDGTGVASVAASAKAADVFTTTGIRVGNSTENLPAGVYIVGGKKVVVR